MVSIKHLPFLVELTNDQELNEFAPDGRSIVPSPIQPITELLDTLVGINRVPDELLDAQQLLHRLTTLPKRRGS